MWLSYALVRLITENKAVAYHSGNETFLFVGNSVYSRILGANAKFPSVKPATFCLIDSDQEKEPVDIKFMTDAKVGMTFPIMASSPQPSRYHIWKNRRVFKTNESLFPWNLCPCGREMS
jgi:hypothetical protein